MHSPEFGDYIGVESCADLKSEVDTSLHRGQSNRRRMRLEAAEKEYPPPIPWLARTENLPSHMPWVMKKCYTGDGRLIIKEEKVKRHEYFQAHRSNGRLVLNLIPLDDAVEERCKEHHHGEEESEISGEEINAEDEGISNPTVDEAVTDYYKYINGMGVNPCGGFSVAAQTAFRPPVHT